MISKQSSTYFIHMEHSAPCVCSCCDDCRNTLSVQVACARRDSYQHIKPAAVCHLARRSQKPSSADCWINTALNQSVKSFSGRSDVQSQNSGNVLGRGVNNKCPERDWGLSSDRVTMETTRAHPREIGEVATDLKYCILVKGVMMHYVPMLMS